MSSILTWTRCSRAPSSFVSRTCWTMETSWSMRAVLLSLINTTLSGPNACRCGGGRKKKSYLFWVHSPADLFSLSLSLSLYLTHTHNFSISLPLPPSSPLPSLTPLPSLSLLSPSFSPLLPPLSLPLSLLLYHIPCQTLLSYTQTGRDRRQGSARN